ncbi:MAG TPA: glycine--tRNA ligase subunit beta [Chloroflexi bacterium]|nr:glycine--tRNA ligase subunit beta [Chloroflexota bacterium]
MSVRDEEFMKNKALSFQEVILRLQSFWADHGCLIWQPYSEKVGAGTMNPATALRVLGPEPWNVGYVEPSYRPDDGRFGDNPNRMQMHTQFQVILKPDPGNPQELYLDSLYALGIDREEHDIRFVEDNWESPALGAWGLGWEIWLDGLEITQFTYFQQAGGFVLDPVAVELTYGLERIVMFLQSTRAVWDIDWDGAHTYGDVLLQPEIQHCEYAFNLADIERLSQMFDFYEAEARRCLTADLVIPAYDYVLRCSHNFNLLDTRGAIGVTERATYFHRMRDLSRQVSEAYVAQRERMGYPWLGAGVSVDREIGRLVGRETGIPVYQYTNILAHQSTILEIGTEELPAGDLDDALAQLREMVPERLAQARLDYDELRVLGTPRRLAVLIEGLAAQQDPIEELVKGPPVRIAYDDEGNPTKAAQGFARSQGVSVDALEKREMDGGRYVLAVKREEGLPTIEVLPSLLHDVIAGLNFGKSMRWNESGVAFSRPIRWLLALMGETVIPLEYAGVASARTSRGPRPEGSPPIEIDRAEDYPALMRQHQVMLDPEERRAFVAEQAEDLAQSVGGRIPDDPDLLDEVANLVEQPYPFLGHFEEKYLSLPAPVLVAVMKKHQRYFPVYQDERLLPYFVAVRNGDAEHLDVVRHGNEEVIRARFADAHFFYREDVKQPLEAYVPRLDTLTFQEQLGSMLDKTRRLEKLAPQLADMLALTDEDARIALRAAHLCKADLATQMVVEMTSLQGVMGREYALKSGEEEAVAQAIFEHYLPRSAGDVAPQSKPGLLVGLANRLDSLIGLFAVGLAPTGSSDPYHLRRDALGLIQNLMAHHVSFSVREGLAVAARLLPLSAAEDIQAEALAFVIERLRGILREEGFDYDVVDAVLAARGDDPYRAKQSVEQLSRWIEHENWDRILDNYARCVRITRGFEERFDLDPERFVEAAETQLYQAYRDAEVKISPDSTVDAFFEAFAPLVDVIDHYFARESGVMVMDEDEVVRQNRLAQLQHIAALVDGVVDLSRLEGF